MLTCAPAQQFPAGPRPAEDRPRERIREGHVRTEASMDSVLEEALAGSRERVPRDAGVCACQERVGVVDGNRDEPRGRRYVPLRIGGSEPELVRRPLAAEPRN